MRRAGDLVKCLALCLLSILLLAYSAAAMEKGLPNPTGKDKCPVCGMFVVKYPDWTTVIIFKEGSPVFFDGAKDMFKYLLDLKRYDPARKRAEIQAIMVKSYYTLTWINAQKAWYVLGSDVFGPMGRELIPLDKEGDAKEFLHDHKGKKILRFSEITQEVVNALD